jgi:hypothetical protein
MSSTANLNTDTQRILRLAAGLGVGVEQLRDVTFSGLFTALLFGTCVTPTGSGAAGLQVETAINVTNGNTLWREAQSLGLLVDRILDELHLDHAKLRRTASAVGPGPQQISSLAMSSSARMIVQAACEIAEAQHAREAVAPVALLQAYLSAAPTSHQAQLRRWGLTAEVSEKLRARFGLIAVTTPTAKEDLAELDALPGFDESASAVIRLTWAFTARRRDRDTGASDAAELLVAAAETPGLLPQHARPELLVLREALGANEPNSPYRAWRERYSLLLEAQREVQAVDGVRPTQTRRLQAILASAQNFARATGSPLALTRHLLGALITEDDGTTRSAAMIEDLPDRWVDKMRDALTRVIADRYPDDDHQAWADRLVGPRRRLVATMQPDTIPRPARAYDKLDLRRYADAIGALIAAEAQNPPLSIAVFGAWGSGKSFFMRMVQEAAQEFVDEGARAAAAGQANPFHHRIVQIEFNAWHYVEANLWASLVHAILEGLQRALSLTNDGEVIFERLLSDLSLCRAAEAEARQRLSEAENRKAEAAAALKKAQAEANDRRAAQQQLAAEDVLGALRDTALAELRPRTSDPEAWIRSVGDAAGRAAQFLGRPELATNLTSLQRAAHDGREVGAALQTRVGEVEDLLNEARANASRGSALVAWLANARFDRDDRTRLIVPIAACFAASIVLAIVLQQWGGDIAGRIATAAAVIAPILVGAGSVVDWARRNLSEASKAFSVLEGLRDRVAAARTDRLSRHELALQAAHRAAADAESDASRRRADVEAAEAARRKAEEEVNAASSAEQMKRFIASRLADGDYQRHLGLIHTIRRDMERLGAILADMQAMVPGSEPPIRRIVLYVDDLDRCPPARVVEVLESVLLLLAFPLFVVVVGVDIRWVSQALLERYPRQLAGTRGIAAPIDYLEKVFQIPFWLPPMDAAGGEKLLAAMIGGAGTEKEPVAPLRQSTTPQGTRGTSGRPSDATAPTANLSRSALRDDAPGEPVPVAPPAAHQVPVETLTLSAGERRNLISLAAAVGISPRRAKRFANLYRLLKASLSPSERRNFLLENGRDGSFSTAMALLAATTGTPIAAKRLIAALDENSDARRPVQDQLEAILEQLEVPAAEQLAWGSIQLALPQRPYISSDLTELRFWATRIQRFSFDLGQEDNAEHSDVPVLPLRETSAVPQSR